MTTTGQRDEVADCGCPAADAARGIHEGGDCLCQYVIAIAEADLPADPDPIRLRFHAGEHRAPIAFGDQRIVPPLAILNISEQDWGEGRDGLWQRQAGDWYVPISLDTYRAHVRRCHGDSCGHCEQCTELAAYLESRATSYGRLDEAMDKAESAINQALLLMEEVAAGADTDTNEELTFIQVRDLRCELEDAARRTRSARRITSLHLTKLRGENDHD